MNDKFLNFLGICKKAGKLTAGADAVIDAVKKNKSKIVFFTADFSINSLKKVEEVALKSNVKTIKLFFFFNLSCI